MLYNYPFSPGAGFFVPVVALYDDDQQNLPNDIRAGIEEHAEEVQNEEDMRRMIHELWLRQ
ncbi:MAG TPA: hypothetical protein IAA80_11140 [Candidatus Gallacutalibacter pullistercoris]|nr:hypothetical protein [Candidatus Gallacutalibacter pullistercoris]